MYFNYSYTTTIRAELKFKIILESGMFSSPTQVGSCDTSSYELDVVRKEKLRLQAKLCQSVVNKEYYNVVNDVVFVN